MILKEHALCYFNSYTVTMFYGYTLPIAYLMCYSMHTSHEHTLFTASYAVYELLVWDIHGKTITTDNKNSIHTDK